MALVKQAKRISRRKWFGFAVILLLSSIAIIAHAVVSLQHAQEEANREQSPSSRAQKTKCDEACAFSPVVTPTEIEFNPSNIIRHFPSFVCPQNFRNIADWVYGWPNQFHEQMANTTNQEKYIGPCLPPGSIIYVRIWVMNEFFEKVYPYLQNSFVLITGEGDVSSPTHIEHLERSDSKIIHWFGQNGQYDVSRSKKFTHIPKGKPWFRCIFWVLLYVFR